ncbi:hypothetical protein [Litorihabitans aurantiacus]|uniref:Uncharacterized protein n=1 Tax=Litorihabitans aurantiacus TaxID=1930061 RepID=A0AA37XD25_9MICO|nr:hypothetical protein [Litorihabitans aurantiacus]GMA30916.1 hypothetical protein GCM10025875_09080 [Litorihabitans aurantiacus]
MPLSAGGLLYRDHLLTVPVDREDHARFGTIPLHAREVVDPERDGEDLPCCCSCRAGRAGAPRGPPARAGARGSRRRRAPTA